MPFVQDVYVLFLKLEKLFGKWNEKMSYIKKHKKIMFIIGIAILLLVIFFLWQRENTREKTLSAQLEDNPRKETETESQFYFKQLTKKEQEIYLFLEENIKNLKGGVLTLPEPVNGNEYQRIVTALECEGKNYFYGFIEIPMTSDEVFVQHKEKELNTMTENEISKVILFLSCAEGVEIQVSFAPDGKIANLDEIREGLAVNNESEVDEIHRKLQNTEMVFDEIMAGVPKDSGEKDTVDYFLNWLKENMDSVENIKEEKELHVGEVLDKYYTSNHEAALLEGEATSLGYSKILAELCNRAGMEAHIVTGLWQNNWGENENYALCAVAMNGKTVYVDASGMKSGIFEGKRYLTEEEAFQHLKTAEYFSYLCYDY